jgi:Tfp pilus assembly protein PilV
MAGGMAEAATAAFAIKVQRMLDLAHADMNFVHTQTTRRNHKQLLQWAEHMRQHEARTELHERVYLVASDLRLVVTSQQSSDNSKWQKSRCRQRRDTFLEEKDVRTLHEKHWAVEINRRHYELVRSAYGSRFSCTNRVEWCDRQITARIFVGTTHCEHNALEEIGIV